MQSLKELLNTSFNLSNGLLVASYIIDKAEVKLGFCGNRQIVVKDVTGTGSLFDLTKKIEQISYDRLKADNLTPQERIAGMKIAQKLTSLYKESDELISKSFIFIRIFNVICEFFFPSFGRGATYKEVFGRIDQNFRSYSEKRFTQEIGGQEGKLKGHPDSEKGGCGPFIIAKKQSIQAQVR